MKTHILLVAAAIQVSSLSVEAGAVLNIRGKLTSMTEKALLIETEKSIFYIKKSELPKAVMDELTRTEVEVALAVPFEAIDQVKAKPPK